MVHDRELMKIELKSSIILNLRHSFNLCVNQPNLEVQHYKLIVSLPVYCVHFWIQALGIMVLEASHFILSWESWDIKSPTAEGTFGGQSYDWRVRMKLLKFVLY